jgi:hypothetical protein
MSELTKIHQHVSLAVTAAKDVDVDVDAFDDSIFVRLLQLVAVPVIGSACHMFMHGLNHVQVCSSSTISETFFFSMVLSNLIRHCYEFFRSTVSKSYTKHC